jgi:glutaconate CoA-transferase subunit A
MKPLIDKTTDLPTVIQLVQDGQTLALGGMTLYRRPVAFVRCLLQQKPLPQALTLLSFTSSLAADMLVGAGVVRQTRTCYFGLESFGLAPMFTMAAAEGRLEIIEESTRTRLPRPAFTRRCCLRGPTKAVERACWSD